MAQVVALRSFTHGNLTVRKGDKFPLPDFTAADLKRAGLVSIVLEEVPAKKSIPVPPAPLFVLPPDLPSPQKTATELPSGERKQRRKRKTDGQLP